MSQFSILVADDDTECREAVRETLDREGLRILTAGCGAEAIEIVKREGGVIHASILDMHMPDLTGLETLEALFRLVDRLPTIFMTGDSSKELFLKAMEAGAYTLLKKPVSAGLIVVTIHELLGKYYDEARH